MIKKLNESQMADIEKYISIYARPIDYMRYLYHKNQVSNERVMEILKHYQNKDGGFGHGLESDCLNPFSSPMQTWCALEYMAEVNVNMHQSNQALTMLQLTFDYLINTKDTQDNLYFAAIKTNNDFPHAPWWTYHDHVIQQWGTNPTAAIAGLMLHFADQSSNAFSFAKKLAENAITIFLSEPLVDSKHTLHGYNRLYDVMNRYPDEFVKYQHRFNEKLRKNIAFALEKDQHLWMKEYCNMPIEIISSPTSFAYKEHQEIVNENLNVLIEAINDEGIWDIAWDWNNEYNEQFALAKVHWKCIKAIENVNILKRFNRIDTIRKL